MFNSIIPIEFDASISFIERMKIMCRALNTTIKNVNHINEIIEKWKEEVQKEVSNYLDVLKNNGYIASEIDNIVKSKKILFIGDSYILGYSQNNPPVTSYAEMIKTITGLDITIMGHSGAGFVASGEGFNFQQILSNYDDSIASKDSITDIYVFGGYNDRLFDSASIYGAMQNFKNYVAANFKNAKVHLAHIGFSQIAQEYVGIMATAECYSRCGAFNMAYINGAEDIMHDSAYFANDNIHPNTAGHNALASYLSSYILGGGISTIKQRYEITPTAINGVQLGTMSFAQQNNMITLSMTDSVIVDFSQYSATFWGNEWIEISGKFATSLMLGYWQSYASVTVLWNKHNSTEWYTAPATIKLVNGKLYIQIQAVNQATGLYNGLIDQVLIPAFTMQSIGLIS